MNGVIQTDMSRAVLQALSVIPSEHRQSLILLLMERILRPGHTVRFNNDGTETLIDAAEPSSSAPSEQPSSPPSEDGRI